MHLNQHDDNISALCVYGVLGGYYAVIRRAKYDYDDDDCNKAICDCLWVCDRVAVRLSFCELYICFKQATWIFHSLRKYIFLTNILQILVCNICINFNLSLN